MFGLADALLLLFVEREAGSWSCDRPVKAGAISGAVVCFSVRETWAFKKWFAFPLMWERVRLSCGPLTSF